MLCHRCQVLGITPAWAGKRPKASRSRPWPRDHPRVGGEKSWWGDEVTPKQGSPPRGRGKVGPVIQLRACAGITPARAGKRPSHSSERRRPQDHPRMGGEKPFLFYGGSSDSGSPPYGRGKAENGTVPPQVCRITPAWAGKSCGWASCGGLSWDHPRMGGEKMADIDEVFFQEGSPPRGRGKVRGRKPFLQEPWITPAWAGKCRPEKAPHPAGRDHPRVGGEKKIRKLQDNGSTGSPPHGRGKEGRESF